MNQNERQLLDGLRALAAMEPREASPRVEQTLRAAFRARAERRRRAWGAAAAAAVAIAAAMVVLLFAPLPWQRNQAAPRAASESSSHASNVPDIQYAVGRSDDLAASFYPLPEADELPPLETSLVVRVQLPVSSLQMMGFPVSEAGAEPVQAEVLLGQDGLARGVRLIQ